MWAAYPGYLAKNLPPLLALRSCFTVFLQAFSSAFLSSASDAFKLTIPMFPNLLFLTKYYTTELTLDDLNEFGS